MGDVRLAWLMFVTAVIGVSGDTTLTAQISAAGYKGVATFSQSRPGENTVVTINIAGFTSPTWKIKSLRVKYDVADRCGGLGDQYTALTGTGNSATITASDLNDLRTLCGKPIEVTDTTLNKITCGTLEESGDHVTVIARFQSKVGGLTVLRQLANSPTSCTSLYADLFALVNTENAITQEYTSEIYEKEIPTSLSPADASFCANLGNVYNPKSVSGAGCSKGSPENCKVGDLSGKLGNIVAGPTPGSLEIATVDFNLPLSGPDSIDKKTWVFKQNGQVVTCARLKVIKSNREASVMFSRNGVMGSINFAQQSPYDPTTVTVNLQNLQSQAGGYHVHLWPVPQKIADGQSVCGGDSVGGHFNPFSISAPPSAGTGTDDQYEIGDLSNKYGLLTGKTDVNMTKIDYNLPLFGRHSIVGRSIVIHKSSDGSRWLCSTIQPKYAVKKSQARFVHKVIGHILLSQASDDWELDETQVYVELNYATRTDKTVDHKWHIHVTRIDGTIAVDDPQRCSSVGGHYNPFVVDLLGNYSTDCKPSSPLRCELGDLSGKHGKLNIRTDLKTAWRTFFTDVNLPLSGPESVAARSIVIHDAQSGPGRLTCADLYDVVPIAGEVKTWASMSSIGSPSYVKFVDGSAGYLEGITNVAIRLATLNDVDGFHVHVYPMANNKCDGATVGGHYNPLGVVGSPASGTDDQYEIGDLSGKYSHPLVGQSTFNGMFSDTNLPLRGVTSVLGRSVVIHKSSGDRWNCGSITLDTAASKVKWTYMSEAKFTTGMLRGSIKMTQYLFEDGGLSDTGVLVDLKYAANPTRNTNQHNWHVHVSPVGTSTDCGVAGGHYNPYKVDLTNGYDECSRENPLRCESGDQAKKLGTYDIGLGRRFFTDVSLNLIGPYSVTGRSFVIHAENKGAPRIACADIVPLDGKPNSLMFRFPNPNSFSMTAFKSTLASALKMPEWEMYVGSSSKDENCMGVEIEFQGPKGAAVMSNLKLLMSKNDKSLGIYKPGNCSATGKASGLSASVSFLTAILFIYCILRQL